MFELKSKIDGKVVTVDTSTMTLLRTIMFHAKVPTDIVDRFSTNSKMVIGEKAAKDIADKLAEVLPVLMQGVRVEKRKVIDGKVAIVISEITLTDLALLQAFILFNKQYSPYEIL